MPLRSMSSASSRSSWMRRSTRGERKSSMNRSASSPSSAAYMQRSAASSRSWFANSTRAMSRNRPCSAAASAACAASCACGCGASSGRCRHTHLTSEPEMLEHGVDRSGRPAAERALEVAVLDDLVRGIHTPPEVVARSIERPDQHGAHRAAAARRRSPRTSMPHPAKNERTDAVSTATRAMF